MGSPKIVSIIKLLCGDFRYKVICGQYLTEVYEIKASNRVQIAVDWAIKETTLGTKAGIKWTFIETLDDLGFADYIALLSHSYEDTQSKSETLAKNARK